MTPGHVADDDLLNAEAIIHVASESSQVMERVIALVKLRRLDVVGDELFRAHAFGDGPGVASRLAEILG